MENTIEIWKDIEGYEGLYQVSNLGNVKSLNRIVKRGTNQLTLSERILTQLQIGGNENNRYQSVILSKDGTQKTYYVHRLVGMAFLSDTYFDGAEINHIDENPQNNRWDNLEWCDRTYNNNYGRRTQYTMKDIPRKPTEHTAEQIEKSNKFHKRKELIKKIRNYYKEMMHKNPEKYNFYHRKWKEYVKKYNEFKY